MQGPGPFELSGAAGSSSAPGEGRPPVDGLSPGDRRRLRRAWWCAAGPLLALYLWILTVGQADLFRSYVFDDFFDAQARSFLDGRLDVPPDVVKFEGFLIDGKTYIYFGPVPALLRIPVLLVTDRLDGRLSTLSMLAAAVVLAAASFRLLCAVRAMVRGTDPVGRRERLATGAMAVATVASPPFFLASTTMVYHEATMWGIALAVAGFDAVARYQLRPTGRRLALASLLITAAVLSRQTLGLGPLVALGLVGGAMVLPSLRGSGLAGTARTSPASFAPLGWVRTGRAWLRRVRPPGRSILPERPLTVPDFGTVTADRPATDVDPVEPVAAESGLAGAGGRNGGGRPDATERATTPPGDPGLHEPTDGHGEAGDNDGEDDGTGEGRPDTRAPVPSRRLVRTVGALALAGTIPVVASVGLNHARFGTLLSPPSDKHVASLVDPGRQEVLRAADGSLFGPQFVPTTLKQYLRPDGLDVRRDFPWIDFPRLGPSLVGDTKFDQLDWTSSLPASAPTLTALTGVAVVWAVRTRRERRGGPRCSPLWLGALAGGAGVIAFGYVANRYLTDLTPIVLVPAFAGFHLVVERAPRWRPQRRQVVAATLSGLVALGAVANTALALSYQRERGPVIPEEWRAEWISWRTSLPGAYPPITVDRDLPILPQRAFDGRLAIIGECDGMYVRVGKEWQGVERGPDVGVYDLEVDLDALRDGERVPLITLGRGARMTIVAIRRLDDEWVRVDASRPPGTAGGWRLGSPTRLSGTVTLRIDTDVREPPNLVTHGRQVLLRARLGAARATPVVGRAPRGHGVAPRYPDGAVTLVPAEHHLCRSVHPGADDERSGGPAG